MLAQPKVVFIHLFLLINLFISGCVGSSLPCAGCSSLWCPGFSLRWLLLLQSTGSRCVGFSSCGSRAVECRLSSCGTRAWRHVGSSQTRAGTRVPCIGRQILNHCATKEVPKVVFKKPNIPTTDFENKNKSNVIRDFISLNILSLKPSIKGTQFHC